MADSNDADLNAFAAAAEGYDELYLFTDDPGTDHTVFVEAGPVAIVMGSAGAVGPDAVAHAAAAGRVYQAAPVSVSLSVECPYMGVRNSSTGAFRSWRLRRGPLGPGTFPLVYALAAANKS